jgi:hypothetical protein
MGYYDIFLLLAQYRYSFRMTQGHWLVLLVLVIIGITAIVLGIVYAITTLLRRRMEIEFRRDLTERGMTADEIAKIVASKPPRSSTQAKVTMFLPHA